MSDKAENIRWVIDSLIGSTKPIGESNIDAQRLQNLKVKTTLIEDMLYEVCRLASLKSRDEASIKAIGNHADGFINYIISGEWK